MRKIKNIARPCGDCWTNIESESLAFRLMCWTDQMYVKTGKYVYERASVAVRKLARVDWRATGLLALICALWMLIGMAIGTHAASPDMGAIQPPAGTYPQALKVVDVQDMDGEYVVTFRTANGALYALVTDDGDFCPLEMYAAIMDDMGTASIADDTITSLRYTGF